MDPELEQQRSFDVQVLFGDRKQEMYRALTRALIELVAEKSSKSLILGGSESIELFTGSRQASICGRATKRCSGHATEMGWERHLVNEIIL